MQQLNFEKTKKLLERYKLPFVKSFLLKSEKQITKYCDAFFEKEKDLISEVREKSIEKKILSQKEAKKIIGKIKKKENMLKKRLRKLEDELLHTDKKIAGK